MVACLLRIEDLDRTRCKPQFEAAIVDDLAWLGLRFPAPRRQSEHGDDYAAALTRLDQRGLGLSLLLQPRRRSRAIPRRSARPGRRAALSWNMPRALSGRSARPTRARRQGRVPPRHAARDRRRASAVFAGANTARAPFPRSVRRRRRFGATLSSAAAIWRQAIISRWWSTTPCRA